MLCAELFEARLAAGAGLTRPGGSVRLANAPAEAAAGPAAAAEPARTPPASAGPEAEARSDDQGAATAGPAVGSAPPVRLGDALLATAGSAVRRTLGPAIAAAAEGVALLVQTGQDRTLARAVAEVGLRPVTDGGPGSPPPAVSIDGDPSDDASIARAAAALFAVGAMTRPDGLYAKRPSRPIDIWHDPVFITHPCQRPVRMPQVRRAEPVAWPAAAAPRPAASAATSRPRRRGGRGGEAGRGGDHEAGRSSRGAAQHRRQEAAAAAGRCQRARGRAGAAARAQSRRWFWYSRRGHRHARRQARRCRWRPGRHPHEGRSKAVVPLLRGTDPAAGSSRPGRR